MNDDVIAAALARLPELAIEPEAVRDLLEHKAIGEPLGDEALAEIVLAGACARGDRAALAVFERDYLARVKAALAHMRLSPDVVDEVRQEVRNKLLVASSGETKIEAYAGKGRLRGLVQVVAVRTAISLQRKERGVGDAPLERLADLDPDPELRHMKETSREAFRAAFEKAVRALTSRDRNLLRLQLEGGLTVEQLGEVYGVHRATATRWLHAIRTRLVRDTRRSLGEALGAAPEELDSLMALIESRLDVSVRRMLETIDEATPDPSPSTSRDA